MNLADLKSKLDAAAASQRAYSFTSDGLGEVHRIARIEDPSGVAWQVYYAERGQRMDLRVFRSEAEACEEMLRRLMRDPLTRSSAYPAAHPPEDEPTKA